MSETTQPLLVREMVADQMRTATATIDQRVTHSALIVLTVISIAFAAAQTVVLHDYLPAESLNTWITWTLPIAVQVLIMAAELILLGAAVTRSTPVLATAGAVMTLGYGAEITAHISQHKAGEPLLLAVAMVLLSLMCGGAWTLLMLSLQAGIDDADKIVLDGRAKDAEAAPLVELEGRYAELQTAHAELAGDFDRRGLEIQQRSEELEALREENQRLRSAAADTGSDVDVEDDDVTGGRAGRPPKHSDAELLEAGIGVFREIGPPRSFARFKEAMKAAGLTGSDVRLKATFDRIAANPLATAGD
ncbi:hypothetical protein ACGFYQ_27510 [Streptomyces sp. NPDC048258]|uniref:hypothetical protein n=1 Tax=Streptomyces sp. NPDC048258 TaxID=3365527 RepID=UPI003716670B